ncbi:MAG TPA: hypothetical protein PL182_12925 [Pseudobdellovibrionaceae bacterium]|nr:hypothetical protein [Pseudobdellovibrionaceae bacterium]
MKWITFFFFALALSSAKAQLSSDPRYELMKCTAPKLGTLWASFGHLIRSGEDQMIYFPTEIVWIPQGETASQRRVYWTLDEALTVPISVGPNRFSLQFKMGSTDHQIRLIRYADLAHSFLGSWQSTTDGREIFDEIACTIH